MDVREEVACPACGEMILAVAKKCKHCGERLSPHIKNATLQAPVGTDRDILTREVLFSMSQANLIQLKTTQFTLLTQDGASLGEVGYRLPPLSVSLIPGRHFLQLRNSFGVVPFPVDVSNEEQPLRVAVLATAGGLQAVYNESADSVRSNNAANKRTLWMSLGVIIACCIPFYVMYKLAYDDSFSIGTPSLQATCTPMSGACKITDTQNDVTNFWDVKAQVSGNVYATVYDDAYALSFRCKAYNEAGAFVGEGSDSYRVKGSYNIVASLIINANDKVKSISCTWG